MFLAQLKTNSIQFMLQRHTKITGQTINAQPTYTILIPLKLQTVMRELHFTDTYGVIRKEKTVSIHDHTTQVINEDVEKEWPQN
jgi:hypothetical protein